MDAEELTQDERDFIEHEKHEVVDFFESLARDAQQDLPNFNPLPLDNEYTKFFNTIRIHYIRSVVKLHEKYGGILNEFCCVPECPYEGEDHLKHWHLANDPDHPQIVIDDLLINFIDDRVISFTIGFSANDIYNALDTLDIFDAQAVCHEIAGFAKTHLRVNASRYHCTYIYNDKTFVWKHSSIKSEMIENIDIFKILPHFPSIIYAIQKAAGIDRSYSCNTAYFPRPLRGENLWTEKQRILARCFSPAKDVTKAFNFLQVQNNTDISTFGLKCVINKYKSEFHGLFESMEGVKTYEEYQQRKARNDIRKKDADTFLRSLKRKLEDEMEGYIRSKKKKLE